MSATGPSLEPLFILHRRAYRETSFLLDVFSPHYGRLTLLARGGRTSRNRTLPLIQPFRPLLGQWRGKGDLPTLQQLEEAGRPQNFQGIALACAFYLNELLVKILPKGEANAELFARYMQALEHLENGHRPALILRQFEYALLTTVGTLPDWRHDAENHMPIEPEVHYRYTCAQGFSMQGLSSPETISGSDIIDFIGNNVPVGEGALPLLRRFLAQELSQLIDLTTLKSRELLK